jgi:hypothetical protein
MEIEERVPELSRGKNVPLDSPQRPHEEWLDLRRNSLHRPCDRKTGIEMPARATAREDDAHQAR